MLLYAATDETIQPDSSYQMSGNKISVKTLDLNRDFNGAVQNKNREYEFWNYHPDLKWETHFSAGTCCDTTGSGDFFFFGCPLLYFYGFTFVVHTGFVFPKPIPQARRRMSREAPAELAGSTTGETLITRRETLSPLLSGTRIVPEKWFAANCEVMTEALLTLLLMTI